MSDYPATVGNEARGAMDDRDYTLSMQISPRARRPEDNEGLRTVLVNRLGDSRKAVARIGLRNNRFSVFCEPCERWTVNPEDLPGGDDFPTEFRCPHCRRLYELEFAVLEEVEEGPDGR